MDNGALRLATAPGVTRDEYGLVLPNDLAFHEWELIGKDLQVAHRAILFWLGDWLAYGEHKYGEMYTQAIEVSTYSLETLKKCKAIAERIPRGNRIPELGWSHHMAVAYLPPTERVERLQQAAENNWSRRELQDAIKRTRPKESQCFWDYHVLTQCPKHQRPIGECRVPVFDLDAHNGNPRPNGSISHDPPLR